MPCGCFGGGGKKKGSPRGGSEAPPKPPKLPIEEPIKQQNQVSAYTVQPTGQSRPENGTTGGGTGNGPVNGTATPAAEPTAVVATPTSETQSAVDGASTKSSGARSRAELYAKRREFFRPLYDVSLSSTIPNSQRFTTPRSSNTLPSRGKRGAYLMGDGNGYFTAEGRYVANETGGNAGDGTESSELMAGDDGRGADGSTSFLVNNENQYVDEDGRVVDRPPRPTSQPSAIAGQWEELMDQEGGPAEPQDEFHQKHKQIIQQQQQPGFIPPPPPKEVNPHYIEFQEKHHKILYDPESHQHHKPTDPELEQKLAENRLTELDKLHNEVQEHYEKRMKHGPVDVDSLVEQYTEDRWKKMVENWEREGLVVEGGIVVVDDKGNAVERKMTASPDGGHVVERITRVTERVNDEGETVIERIEQEGNKVVRVVETNREMIVDGDRLETVKHTEEILIEQFNDNPPTSVTTIVTPPTPQIDVSSKTTPLADLTADQIAAVERELEKDEQYTSEQQNPSNNYREDYLIEEEEAGDNEPLLEMDEDDLLEKAHGVIERERLLEESPSSSNPPQPNDRSSDDPYRVSPPPSPPASPSQSVPPQTCTPPPSPQREHRAPSPPTEDISIVCGGGQTDIVLTKSSATPPPSPPLQAAADQ